MSMSSHLPLPGGLGKKPIPGVGLGRLRLRGALPKPLEGSQGPCQRQVLTLQVTLGTAHSSIGL